MPRKTCSVANVRTLVAIKDLVLKYHTEALSKDNVALCGSWRCSYEARIEALTELWASLGEDVELLEIITKQDVLPGVF